MSNKLIKVRFIKNATGVYNIANIIGEVAEFSKAQAEQLLAGGFVVNVADEKAQATAEATAEAEAQATAEAAKPKSK